MRCAAGMALDHVIFPQRLLTDCDAVRSGVLKPFSWAQSSKRRYSRIWTAIALQLDDSRQGLVQWMPAHTVASSFGHRITSAGEIITETMWCANQIADLLAKDGAEAVRYGSDQRQWFVRWETQLKELAIFLGKLTYIANAFPFADGTKLRDSNAVKSKRRPRASERVGKPGPLVKPIVGRVCAPPKRAHNQHASSDGRRAKISKAKALHEAELEASFFDAWRQERAQSLKASCGPSASERLNALRQRIAARGAAPSS